MKKLIKYTEIIKHLERQGWKRYNISNPETVASHSWQMSILALFLSQNNHSYDFYKVIKLCLVHDLAESLIGDITPKETAYQNKPQQEQIAAQKISEECNFQEFYNLFNEYDENATQEAKLAHDLDKIDMYIQSKDYEEKHPKQNLEEFRISALSEITTPLGKSIIEQIK